MKRVCLYHGVDLDGFCGGAIYDKYWSSKCNQGEDYEGHEIIPMNYGWEVPWEKLEGAEVTLIDFCLQPWGEMNKLLAMAESVWLIDHHQTTIENYRRMTTCGMQKLKVSLNDKFSGCELAWYHFYPESAMPEAVKLLGRYDVRDHSDSRVLPFQYGMRNYDMRPDKGDDKDMWRRLLAGMHNINEIVKEGLLILKYQSRQDEIGSKSSAFEIQWEGLTWIAANSGMGRGSHFFDAVYNPEVHDAMMSFHFNGKEWKFVVYTTKPRIQLGQLAKKYGGGGHNKAAGFSLAEVPFDWKDIVPLVNGRKSDENGEELPTSRERLFAKTIYDQADRIDKLTREKEDIDCELGITLSRLRGQEVCSNGLADNITELEKQNAELEAKAALFAKTIHEQAEKIVECEHRIAGLEAERDEYKRLYDLRGKALQRPCRYCGHTTSLIVPANPGPSLSVGFDAAHECYDDPMVQVMIESRDGKIAELEKQNAKLEAVNTGLVKATNNLHERIEQYEAKCKELEAENERLRNEASYVVAAGWRDKYEDERRSRRGDKAELEALLDWARHEENGTGLDWSRGHCQFGDTLHISLRACAALDLARQAREKAEAEGQ